MTRDYFVMLDGREMEVSVDLADYPDFIIENVTDEQGNEVTLTKDQECEVYQQLGPEIASDLASDADDARDAMEDR